MTEIARDDGLKRVILAESPAPGPERMGLTLL
jgi:hypothetical protein